MFDFITVFMYKTTTYMIYRFSQGKSVAPVNKFII